MASMASATPQVLPVADATEFVDGSVDTIRFCRGLQLTVGTRLELTAPNGLMEGWTMQNADATGDFSPQVWRLDGTQASGQAGVWVRDVGTDFTNAPADGTWTIDFSIPANYDCASSTGFVLLSVQGRSIEFGVRGNFPVGTLPGSTSTWHQTWNWHQGSWVEPSTRPTYTPGDLDPPDEAVQEDPNEARFFSGTGSSYEAFTLDNTVACSASPTMSVNGAWVGATGTVFSRFTYRDGDFTGAPDLRLIPGAAQTAEENEGATAGGTDTKTVAYNNAAGTSYQFLVRDGSDQERLGETVFAQPMQCTVAPPTTAGATNDHEFQVRVSQAQCRDDEVSFTVLVDNDVSAGEDMDVTVVRVDSNTPVLTWDDSVFFATTELRIFYKAEVFAPGPYLAVGTTDQQGILNPDFFDAHPFNVPEGPCTDTPTDLSPVLTAVANVDADLAVHHENMTDYLDHINQHLHDLDGDLNATRGEILDAIEALNLTIQVSFDCVVGNETEPLNGTACEQILQEIREHRDGSLEVNGVDFDGLTFGELIVIALWLIAFLWSLTKGKLLMAVVSTIGVASVLIPGPDWIQWVPVLLFLVVAWLEAIVMERIYARVFAKGGIGN